MNKLPKINLSQKPKYIKFTKSVDFFNLFQKIEQEFETCFIYESLGEEGKLSRYSIIGFDPEHIISARENNLIIDDVVYPVNNPYLALSTIVPDQTLTRDYTGGLIGYLGYDAVNYFEKSIHVKTHDKFDQFMFGVYTDGLILDKQTNELIYFYYNENRYDIVKKVINTKIKKISFKAKFLKDNLTKKTHAKIVEKIKKEIIAGNTFQCEVGMKSEYRATGNSLVVYGRLRKTNPSPFMYYLKFGPSAGSGQAQKIIGASPELQFSLRDGEMITRPLAGTIKRGKNDIEDQQLAKKLLNDPKEVAEHSMLVDLHRNDIGRVARFGTVKIRDLMSVKKFSHVQHISSEIVGIIRPDQDMFSALSSNFPAGTLTGAPKIESMKIIDRNESDGRGPYGGAVGHFGFNGDCTFAIAIRTLFISGEYAYTQTCGGIVYDSVPEKEYDEIQRKAASMKEVLKV